MEQQTWAEMANMEQQTRAETADMETAETCPSYFMKAGRPVTLMFEEIVYKVKREQSGILKGGKSGEKVILKGITGMALPGEMLAMLGPSGSGKTTLLTALGGRLDVGSGTLSGRITYNGKPLSSAIKGNTGFVTQDDVLHPHLTVMETLTYTALLRLPRNLSKDEKVQHAEDVITQLGLSMCRSSIIGGPLLRGVSGGERKRVSIGQEMLVNPSLLFLDEPTSGLDSTTAHRIVSTLQELAHGDRTIVMTIHQPSSRLFYMFHKLLLLSEGNLIYFGEGSTAIDYFSSVGFAPSVAMNPADFLLDLANGISSGDPNEDQAAIKQALVSAYTAHRVTPNHELHLISPVDNQLRRWSNTWWEQFSVLFRRGIKERKHESFSILKIVEVLMVAIMCGLLWWQSDPSHLQDQTGLLFFYSSFWGFYPLFQSIFTFPQEYMILSKERSSGMYRLSSYFMALTVADLPMELVLPTIFYTMTYLMAGLKHTPECFFSGLFVLLYSVLCTQGLGLAIGAIVMDQKSAITFGSVIMLTSLLATGYYVQHLPVFISWIKYVSIAQYTYKLLLISQYSPGETYLCDTNKNCRVEDFPTIKLAGNDHGLVMSVIAMAIMLVGYRLIAYIALTRVGVTRK